MAGGFDATLVAAIGFTTFIGGLIYLKVPGMVAKALDDKSAQIAKELAEAKALREQAEALRKSYEDQQAKALEEAAAILAKAEEDAVRVKAEAEAQLERSIAARSKQAEERIRRAEEAAIADVRAAASSAALAVAERVLLSSVKGKAGEKLVASGIAALETKFN
ncbi:ATP synthase subunit b [Candidatus Phycosocius bacilliformis]|jgi:F-type H+-transporting ATPase subunit b|uniref:ATP synthase subunit b n=1 Tax=Candidatus Phycosocius bacilliformis TaxID=1445552 RepID=A0A2P2E7I3_9PROT|nr:ATP F0F1 synthase subunit B [Candidatus Phycosocius bacilliformis]GBF57019.1 ATP synthase subunit b [Candidatus Phycosocius bacilliformis]